MPYCLEKSRYPVKSVQLLMRRFASANRRSWALRGRLSPHPLRIRRPAFPPAVSGRWRNLLRSEEHTSELQSLMRISYAVFCLKKKKKMANNHNNVTQIHD